MYFTFFFPPKEGRAFRQPQKELLLIEDKEKKHMLSKHRLSPSDTIEALRTLNVVIFVFFLYAFLLRSNSAFPKGKNLKLLKFCSIGERVVIELDREAGNDFLNIFNPLNQQSKEDCVNTTQQRRRVSESHYLLYVENLNKLIDCYFFFYFSLSCLVFCKESYD
eukprot:TRINITY_DN559_c0_g4_i2.p3 TRINITY_DN559_c0_g4~~TRINITY_DN559_c0_g4_i2.p3  ORF type:complete len:164 (-),score=12.00 TRINITY_DN559_c0_g4_i2:152-643(-)